MQEREPRHGLALPRGRRDERYLVIRQPAGPSRILRRRPGDPAPAWFREMGTLEEPGTVLCMAET